jgi:hypothetical protein
LPLRQYARLLAEWIASIGLDPSLFGTHSLRRTKATLILQATGNLGAVQLLLGRTKVVSTVRYLGIEVDDALAIAEQIDVWLGQSGHALPALDRALVATSRPPNANREERETRADAPLRTNLYRRRNMAGSRWLQ